MQQRHDFSFTMNIAKSSVSDTTKMIIRGVASGMLRDRQGDAFSVRGLESIKKSIEDGLFDAESGEWSPIPLLSGHRTEWEDVLGWVTKSWLDQDQNLWIEAELDEDSSKAQELYRKLVRGKVKLGLSVKGQVTDYEYAFDNAIQKAGVFFHNLLTKEISVTSQPVYPTPYPIAIAKSLNNDPDYRRGLEEFMKNNTEAQVDVTKAEGDDYVGLPGRENEEARDDAEVAENATEEQAAGTVETPAQAEQGERQTASQQASAQIARNLTGRLDEFSEAETTPDSQTGNTEDPVAETNVTTPREEDAASTSSVDDSSTPSSEYVGLPNTESTTQEQEVVAEEPSTDSADANDLATLTASVSGVLEAVQTLSQTVSDLQTQIEAVKQQKAQEVQKATSDQPNADTEVQLSSEAFQEQITRAVNTAVASAFTGFTNDIEVIKSVVSELSSQPVDRSIAVSKAKDADNDQELDLRSQWDKRVEGGEDALHAALQLRGNDLRKESISTR